MRLDSCLKIKMPTVTFTEGSTELIMDDSVDNLSRPSSVGSPSGGMLASTEMAVAAPALVAPPPATPAHSKHGVISFVQNYELPDCPISLFVAFGFNVCQMAMHAPSDLGGEYDRSLLALSFGQLDSYDYFDDGYYDAAPANVDQFFVAKRVQDSFELARQAEIRATVALSKDINSEAVAVIEANTVHESVQSPPKLLDLDSRANTSDPDHDVANRPGTNYLSHRLYEAYGEAIEEGLTVDLPWVDSASVDSSTVVE